LIMPLSPNDDQLIAEIIKYSFFISETWPAEEIKNIWSVMKTVCNNLQFYRKNISVVVEAVCNFNYFHSQAFNRRSNIKSVFPLGSSWSCAWISWPCGMLHGVELGSLSLYFWLHKGQIIGL
jgi:hypothetical protein